MGCNEFDCGLQITFIKAIRLSIPHYRLQLLQNLILPSAHVPGSTSLLTLEQHCYEPIRFEEPVYSFCEV